MAVNFKYSMSQALGAAWWQTPARHARQVGSCKIVIQKGHGRRSVWVDNDWTLYSQA